jgi:hypothetical protein
MLQRSNVQGSEEGPLLSWSLVMWKETRPVRIQWWRGTRVGWWGGRWWTPWWWWGHRASCCMHCRRGSRRTGSKIHCTWTLPTNLTWCERTPIKTGSTDEFPKYSTVLSGYRPLGRRGTNVVFAFLKNVELTGVKANLC